MDLHLYGGDAVRLHIWLENCHGDVMMDPKKKKNCVSVWFAASLSFFFKFHIQHFFYKKNVFLEGKKNKQCFEGLGNFFDATGFSMAPEVFLWH